MARFRTLMADPSSVGAQARWWASEYRRRLIYRSLTRLAPGTRTQVLQDIERIDAGHREIQFGWPSPYHSACLTATHVVAPPAMATIPADEQYPREEGHHWSELRVSEFRDVVVDIQTGLVFHEGRVLAASGHSWRSARDGAFLSGASGRVLHPPFPADTRGAIAPMGGAWNYYHFVIECLPRLIRVAQVAPHAMPLFSAPVPDYVRRVLDELDVEYTVDHDPAPVHSQEVWVCDPTPLGWPHPADLETLREFVFDRLPDYEPGLPEKIYVSRRMAGRPMHDEHLLEDSLARRGFEILILEDLPFLMQVRHFRAARVIVTGHGAGEANLAFVDPGADVIELTTGEIWTPSFRQISAQLALRYRLAMLPADPSAPFGRGADALRALDALLEGGEAGSEAEGL